jgi:hypothetical protein
VTGAAASAAAGVTLVVAGGLACARADSTLLVEVTADAELAPASLVAVVSGDARTFRAELSGDPALPAGLEVSLPGDVIGPVTVGVDAFDGEGSWLAGGVTEQAHINAGGDTTIVVRLGDGGMEGLVP